MLSSSIQDLFIITQCNQVGLIPREWIRNAHVRDSFLCAFGRKDAVGAPCRGRRLRRNAYGTLPGSSEIESRTNALGVLFKITVASGNLSQNTKKRNHNTIRWTYLTTKAVSVSMMHAMLPLNSSACQQWAFILMVNPGMSCSVSIDSNNWWALDSDSVDTAALRERERERENPVCVAAYHFENLRSCCPAWRGGSPVRSCERLNNWFHGIISLIVSSHRALIWSCRPFL